MNAELRRIHSPDVLDLAVWQPEGRPFGILLQLLVGPLDEPGEESFDLTLCSADWIAQRVEEEGGFYDARHHLVIEHYDYERLLSYLRRVVSDCRGEDWDAVAQLVGRLGRWEFEDYQPA